MFLFLQVCESCQSPFRTRSQLVQHVRRVHHGGQKTLSHCPSCPTIFENAKDLRKHVQSVIFTTDYNLYFYVNFDPAD